MGNRKMDRRSMELLFRNLVILMVVTISIGLWASLSVLDQFSVHRGGETLILRNGNASSLLLSSPSQLGQPSLVVKEKPLLKNTHQRNIPNNHTKKDRVVTNSIPHSIPHSISSSISNTSQTQTSISDHRRFIVLRHGEEDGQGAGNYMQGLLAVHLLALEYNRTACVQWGSFLKAFDYATEEYARACREIGSWTPNDTIQLWNFGQPNPNECELHLQLASPHNKLLVFQGNTYPGWRSYIPNNFFHHFYRPKPELLHTIPYNIPPKIVVHLRFPDGPTDQDRGLEEEALVYMGQALKGNGTWLVTNRPPFFERFHQCCGWSYDMAWHNRSIRHSALNFGWGHQGRVEFLKHQEEDIQNLKMWADWWTILNAKEVYHSNSDFSRSAVHWNANSIGHQLHGMKTITIGSNNNQTKRVWNLVPAPYDAVLNPIPALVERKLAEGYVKDDSCVYLRFCQGSYQDRIKGLTRKWLNQTRRRMRS